MDAALLIKGERVARACDRAPRAFQLCPRPQGLVDLLRGQILPPPAERIGLASRGQGRSQGSLPIAVTWEQLLQLVEHYPLPAPLIVHRYT